MLLFIQPIGKNIECVVIDNDELIHTENITGLNKEFEIFPEILIHLINTYAITEIFCITGPGTFTRVRILTLAVNTIGLTRKDITLRGTGFFEFCRLSDIQEPYIIDANKHEFLIMENGEARFIKKGDLSPGKYYGFGDEGDFTERGISVQYSHTPEQILQVFHTLSDVSLLSPIYIKEPHITGPK